MQDRSGHTNNFVIISIVLLVCYVAVVYAPRTFHTNAVLNVVVTSLGSK